MLEGGNHNLYIETLYWRLSKWRVTVLERVVVSYFGVVLVLNSSLSKLLHVKKIQFFRRKKYWGKKEKEYYDITFADLIVGSFVSSRIARYKLDNAGNPSGSILRDIESTDRIWPRIIG